MRLSSRLQEKLQFLCVRLHCRWLLRSEPGGTDRARYGHRDSNRRDSPLFERFHRVEGARGRTFEERVLIVAGAGTRPPAWWGDRC